MYKLTKLDKFWFGFIIPLTVLYVIGLLLLWSGKVPEPIMLPILGVMGVFYLISIPIVHCLDDKLNTK